MTKTLISILILGTFAVAGAAALNLPAMAEEAECPGGPHDKWIGLDGATAKAASLGYDVYKVEIDDGCYKLKGHDKNGADVKFNLDPVTGQLVPRESEKRHNSKKD